MDADSQIQDNLRTIYRTAEFDKFYASLPKKVQDQFLYVFMLIQSIYNISTRFVKHLENTDLYEMRVSIGSNEYRSIIFALDNPNIIEAKRIILLNGFLKKSGKDYKKQIESAQKILNNLQK